MAIRFEPAKGPITFAPAGAARSGPITFAPAGGAATTAFMPVPAKTAATPTPTPTPPATAPATAAGAGAGAGAGVGAGAGAGAPAPVVSAGAGERVIDEQSCLDQCGDWKFVVELLTDLLAEEENNVLAMRDAIARDDHKAYSHVAHGIKGAALNLHLPALTGVSKAAEFLGKDLMAAAVTEGGCSSAQLVLRAPYLEHLRAEYARVRDYIPEAQKRADEDGGEGDGDYSDG